jgi:putative Holliday junction resolvase
MSIEIVGKKILSLDYGTTVVGIASFWVNHDPFVLIYDNVKFTNNTKLVNKIEQIIHQEMIDLIVLGVPYQEDGSLSSTTQKVLDFAKILAQKISIPLYYQDESFSTHAAMDRMKNDPRFNFKVDLSMIDSVAATIILEDFLRKNGYPI